MDGGVPPGTVTGSTTAGTAVLVVVLVVVLVLVLVVLVLGAGVLVSAASSAGAGFCHTDCVVGAPRLGNRLSRIAYAAPTDPSTTTAVTMATVQAPFTHKLAPPRLDLDAE
ncbi:MAG TPA: hypothetical protein VFV63_06230, partial [Ilumatobacteraceae bacterium]|nr:hypothetical protein [Ilumatobacteraceae bacterium]